MQDSNSVFVHMVDELVKFSEHDPELAEGIRWLDGKAQQRGITFYDIVFEVLYKYNINSQARQWFTARN